MVRSESMVESNAEIIPCRKLLIIEKKIDSSTKNTTFAKLFLITFFMNNQLEVPQGQTKEELQIRKKFIKDFRVNAFKF